MKDPLLLYGTLVGPARLAAMLSGAVLVETVETLLYSPPVSQLNTGEPGAVHQVSLTLPALPHRVTP